MGLYELLFRLLLVRLDAEVAHQMALGALEVASLPLGGPLAPLAMPPATPRLTVERFGLRFPNPLGVAAGLDKDAVAVRPLLALGFGHVEVGTVTPRPQPGNPPPRLFRLVEDRALINRLGFPSDGIDPVAARLVRLASAPGVLGVNLGKNKDTPLEEASRDYLRGLAALGPFGDYATMNVSSPNTPGLRALQGRVHLDALCAALVAARPAGRHGRPLPLLLKLAPDLTDAELDAALDVALARGLDGVVISNTTVARPPLRSRYAGEAGGLSGVPLRAHTDELIAACYQRTGGRLPIIGVGGVFKAEDAWRKHLLGASLVQAYTGFIYQGLTFPRGILRGLEQRLDRFGVARIADVIGAGIGVGP